MKVLVLSHMFPNTMNEVYGIFVANQVFALAQLGHEVKVVSPVPWSPPVLSFLNKKWAQYARIPRSKWRQDIEICYPRYLIFPQKYFYQYTGWFCYWGIKKTVDEIFSRFNFDVIHAHTALPDGYAAHLLKKDFQRPVVLTIHGQDIFANIHMGPSCRRAVSLALTAADRVVAVSSRLKEEMACLLPAQRIQVIPNGFFPNKGNNSVPELRQEFSPGKVLLSVGYLIERKGHRYVLEALAGLVEEFPGLKYLIIGDGVEESSLKKQAEELALKNHVMFLGRKSSAEVKKYMAMCDVFVLPSWKEAFGVVYLEAMALGKPVIGCRGEGIEDFVSHGENGMLVSPRNPEELYQVLRELMEDQEKADRIGKKGQETVLGGYTWADTARQLQDVYLSLNKK